MSTVCEIEEAIGRLDARDQVRLLQDLPSFLQIKPDDLAWLGFKPVKRLSNSGITTRTRPTMTYDQGRGVLVPFPFTDLSATKQRPGLVLWSDPADQDLIVCAITSQLAGPLGPTEFLIPVSELAALGLPKPSKLKFAKVFTIHAGLARKNIGTAPKPTLVSILERARALFEPD